MPKKLGWLRNVGFTGNRLNIYNIDNNHVISNWDNFSMIRAGIHEPTSLAYHENLVLESRIWTSLSPIQWHVNPRMRTQRTDIFVIFHERFQFDSFAINHVFFTQWLYLYHLKVVLPRKYRCIPLPCYYVRTSHWGLVYIL